MSFDEDDYYDDYEDMSENESLEDGNTDLLDNSSDASEIEFFPDDSESDSSEIAEDSDSSFDQSSNESSTQTDESNGYIFEVDAESGTTTARGEVKAEPASREGMNAIHPDGYDSSTDKGHLIAAAESGPELYIELPVGGSRAIRSIKRLKTPKCVLQKKDITFKRKKRHMCLTRDQNPMRI